MDYVAAVSNGLGYCERLKNCLGGGASSRAVIRTNSPSCSELPAIYSGWGRHALDIGALTPLFYCLREREEILKISRSIAARGSRRMRFASAACNMRPMTNLKKTWSDSASP